MYNTTTMKYTRICTNNSFLKNNSNQALIKVAKTTYVFRRAKLCDNSCVKYLPNLFSCVCNLDNKKLEMIAKSILKKYRIAFRELAK